MELDALDLALLGALRDNPRAGVLQLSRITHVARATVQSRLDRMEKAGVITGYGPDIDVAAAGYGVLAFVTLEITQGALDRVRDDLAAIPGVLEAYAITGSGDVLCQVAATSHADLQQTLLRIDSSPSVARSTSAIALSTVIKHRDLPLLISRPAASAPRSPAFRLPLVLPLTLRVWGLWPTSLVWPGQGATRRIPATGGVAGACGLWAPGLMLRGQRGHGPRRWRRRRLGASNSRVNSGRRRPGPPRAGSDWRVRRPRWQPAG